MDFRIRKHYVVHVEAVVGVVPHAAERRVVVVVVVSVVQYVRVVTLVLVYILWLLSGAPNERK